MIGQRIKRIEDPALLRGVARFADDIHLPGLAEAAFLRSPHPHAAIDEIEVEKAKRAPGVHAVLTLNDLVPALTSERMPLGFRDKTLPDGITPFVLAKNEVCHVGEPVALVVADSRYLAEDAAALINIDYRPLSSVADCRAAIAPDAPRVHSDKPSNVLTEFEQDYGDADRTFSDARHVFSLQLKQHRGGAHPLEGRAVVARYEPLDDRLTVWSSTQMSHELRSVLVKLLNSDERRVHVVAPEVGGGFGAKYLTYAEEIAVAVAARILERPIKWIEDRREHFTSSIQERDQYWDVEVATDGDGKLLAIRGEMIHDNGAYTPQGINLPFNSSTAVPGPYILPAYNLHVTVAMTNKVAAMPVRGAGYPEGTFVMERLLDIAADGLGLGRAEIRRRNLVPPEAMPYTAPLKTRAGTFVKCDSGDFLKCQSMALEAIGASNFLARQQAELAEGRHIGIGIANGLKGTGRGPFESGMVRVGRSGKVLVATGAMPMGQGTKTLLAQICAAELGLEAGDVEVVAGDTDAIPMGLGGFASRQTVTAGSSVHLAAGEVRTKVLTMAAHLLEAAAEDLELVGGGIRVKGAPGLSVGLREVAEAASGVPGYALPPGVEPGLEASVNFMPTGLAYSNSVHAAEVEVDIETGDVAIKRYLVVSDCGKLVNPMMVDGQVRGGVVHGIGNGLFEWMGYDDDGQPLTTNFADYLLPSATDVPTIELAYNETPSPLNPLGVKGVGESGTVPAAAAIASAIEDALRSLGVRIDEVPVKPGRIVELIEAAGTSRDHRVALPGSLPRSTI